MADYSISDVVAAAKQAGFSGANLVTAVALALAEDTARSLTAVGTNQDGSRDRGPWQINDKAHPDISDTCAFDLNCSAAAAYSISSRGTDFAPWTTWGSGAYKQFTGQVQALVDGGVDPTAQQDGSSSGPAQALQAAAGQLLSAGQAAGGALLIVAAVVLAAVLVLRRG